MITYVICALVFNWNEDKNQIAILRMRRMFISTLSTISINALQSIMSRTKIEIANWTLLRNEIYKKKTVNRSNCNNNITKIKAKSEAKPSEWINIWICYKGNNLLGTTKCAQKHTHTESLGLIGRAQTPTHQHQFSRMCVTVHRASTPYMGVTFEFICSTVQRICDASQRICRFGANSISFML